MFPFRPLLNSSFDLKPSGSSFNKPFWFILYFKPLSGLPFTSNTFLILHSASNTFLILPCNFDQSDSSFFDLSDVSVWLHTFLLYTFLIVILNFLAFLTFFYFRPSWSVVLLQTFLVLPFALDPSAPFPLDPSIPFLLFLCEISSSFYFKPFWFFCLL